MFGAVFLLAFLFSYASESFGNSMKTHTLGAGQFVEFILTREWNEAMKIIRTAKIQILNEDMIVAVVIAI